MKVNFRYLIFTSVFFIWPAIVHCQKILYPEYYPPDVRFDNFLIKDGEASQTSLSVLIDSKGFIWSGTETGLYRFDGTRYVEYNVNMGTGEGFTGFTVATIYEDSEGTIWIGTSEALNMLDMKTGQFSAFIPDTVIKSPISNYIRGIREDRDGNMWVLTKKDIYSFDRKNGKFTCYVTDSLSWYPHSYDFPADDECYAEDKMGNKWFVTFKGLYLFNNNSKNFSMVLPDDAHYGTDVITKIKCVKADRDGNLWIGTDGAGLLKWNYSLNKPERIEIRGSGKYYDSFKAVSQILQDSNGSIWSFGDGSFSNYNPENQSIKNYIFIYNKRTIYEYPSNEIFIDQVFQHDDRSIWLLNKLAGLMLKFDPVTEKLSLYRTPSFAVYQSVMDKAGSFWFACSRDNLFRMLINKFPYLSIQVKTNSHVASIHRGSFIQDDYNNVYFLFFQGIFICRNFDISSSLVFDQFRFPDGDIMAGGGFKDSRGKLWFGDKKGYIARYDPVDRSLRLIPHVNPQSYSELVFVPLIREDKNGDIWAANSKGLSRINITDNKLDHILDFPYKPDDKDIKFIQDFLIDSHGDFWILTNKSILLISMPQMAVSDLTDHSIAIILSSGNNLRAAEDGKGNVYILNGRYGIYRFDRGKETFMKVDIGKEEPGPEYYDLLIDRKDRLWVAHNTGITLFDPLNNESRLIRTPKLQFDIQSYQLKSGDVLFLNNDKLYIFSEDVPLNNFIPPVYLTRLQVNAKDYNKIITGGNEISSLKKLDLPFRLNTLNIEFAALNYMNPERNQYRYFMKGFDRDTVHTGQGITADYKNMPPGRYKFWVTGSNNDGLWNPSGVSLDIRIHPPWYRSYLAYALYFLVIGTLAWAYVKRREHNLLKDKKRLEAEVEVATSELKQKNLQLEEIDRIKTHFFTDISHEIRTPLSLIIGPLEKISREEMLSTRVSGMIELMTRNANRLMNLVNQLLDISRLDSGKMKILLTDDDIVKYIRILVYEFLSLSESKQIRYTADLPEKGFRTWFDKDKIEKIITNLLSNAFKYTPLQGTVQCSVRIEPAEKENTPILEIKVADTGPGINKEHHGRIFERFYRVEGHHEAGGFGTGIGLSLVNEFVRLLRGEIRVESEPGRGSVFIVRIPLGKDHLTIDDYVIIELPAGISEMHSVIGQLDFHERITRESFAEGRMRLLVIEDNEDLRTFIRESLESDYIILESENGRIGLNTAFTMMPDLIVTDIMMPDLDGIKLCALLKNDERTSHIPIIMLTAKATSEDKIAGLKTGADDYIVKPFNMTELTTRISNLLDMREKLKLKYDKIHLMEPGKKRPESVDDRFMLKVLKIVHANITNYSFDVGSLMGQLGMSRTHLTRKMKVLTGLTPSILIRNIRLEKALELLSSKAGNITEISNCVGISNPSNFTKAFRNYFGVSPKDYLKH